MVSSIIKRIKKNWFIGGYFYQRLIEKRIFMITLILGFIREMLLKHPVS